MPESNQQIQEREDGIIERCILGNRQAYAELFDLHKETVYRVVYKMMGGSQDIDDAVQQTFIELFRSLPQFEKKSRFSTWLYRIAVNVATQFLRKKHRRTRYTDLVDPETLSAPERTDRTSIEQKDLRKKIYSALAELDLKKRTVVVLHDMEERTMDEIAGITRVPVGTVKSRLFHGREELRRKLKKELDI